MGNLLLVMALGLLLAGGAATATGADEACGAGHHALASASRRVAESCAASGGTPTSSCCESVVAVFPCVCGVAIQNPVEHRSPFIGRLNASRIISLYSSCRGGRLHLRGASYLVTAACRGVIAGVSSFITSSVSSCNSTSLASQVVRQCNIGNVRPSRQCCFVILATIDNQDADCLCTVVDEAEFAISYLDVSTVWRYYTACGGRQQRPPKDTEMCKHAPAPAPSPPPPPPPPSPPRPPNRPPPDEPLEKPSNAASLRGIQVVGLVLGTAVGIAFVVLLAVLAVKAFNKFRGVPAVIPIADQGVNVISQKSAQVEAPALEAPVQVEAEAGQQQQQAVANPPQRPPFAPPVVKEGQAPRAPPLDPLRPPLPLQVPTGGESRAV